jgi:SecD/SecF fusion protein
MKRKKSKLIIFGLTVLIVVGMVAGFAKSVIDNMTLGLDLQGGFEIVYEVSPLTEGGTLPDMTAVVASIRKRIDIIGVNEPDIIIEGTNRIRIQLAGVTNQDEARNLISSTANLEFRDVNDKLLADATILEEGGASLAYENGVVVVSLKIKDKAKFAEITKTVSAMTDNIMVTWLDYKAGTDSYKAEKDKTTPKFISAAKVTSSISGDAVIKGSFTEAYARQLANLINSGSLPVKMSEIYSNEVSAEFGITAFQTTAFAGIIGVIGVALFMILIYRLPGIIASIMLMLYVFTVILLYNSIGGVFTLPGIAGLVLGVGMTVDANIITFERIRDELHLGRSVKKAFNEGHDMSWITIVDSQSTTFIASVIMYIFGTGPVKGFATMLMVTIIITILINVFFVKFLLGLLVDSGYIEEKKTWFNVKMKNIPDVTKGEEQIYFGFFHGFDFIKSAKPFIIGSLVILSLGLGSAVYNTAIGKNPMNLGIDFASGTNIQVNSNIALDETILTQDFKDLGLKDFQVQLSGTKIANVTTTEALSREKLDLIGTTMHEKYGLDINESVVTPLIGNELIKNAILASVIAWILMLLFISFRFEWDYGIATIVALFHDVFIVLSVFAIFRLSVTTELIAVVLAIIGYSVDDTIVIFDRIRETLKTLNKSSMTKDDYKAVVNEALQAVTLRSIWNTATTLIPMVFLLLLGSRAIFTFNFAMFIGLLAGAYSSIFIAAQLWLNIRYNRKPKIKIKHKARKKEDIDEMTVIGIND